MSTLEAGTIEPQSGTTVTLGASGDAVVIGADALKVNTIKDAGANTIFTSNGSGTLSSINSGLTGSMVYINKATASGDATLEFTSGIDSTYDEYIFHWVNIHPATNNTKFTFQANVSGETGFNETITSTAFMAMHRENGTGAQLSYDTTSDQAQGTSYQPLTYEIGNVADASSSGILHLFNPSSTTYVKHFYSDTVSLNGDGTPYIYNEYIAGYFNVTGAITQVSFAMSSGNIDEGTIYLYGIK